ncbi:hypothetical protein P43SY_001812 [Pythium insidiosum]|uniref:DUSP domain-containing protein n=1 Tax=Pythium insidiosum TaxID=114742 RepID=A0AAD5LL12_PYTIN|nr:hypothetical protein P43SY_001812 [Pythium insidiosum]
MDRKSSVRLLLHGGDSMLGRAVQLTLPHQTPREEQLSDTTTALNYLSLALHRGRDIPVDRAGLARIREANTDGSYLWGTFFDRLEIVPPPDVRILNLETAVTETVDNKDIPKKGINYHLHVKNVPLVFARFATAAESLTVDACMRILKELLEANRILPPKERSRDDDLLVLSIHWGPNWAFRYSDDLDYQRCRQILAHRIIRELGVDLIYGHSSHHIRGLELLDGKLIIYGAGDLINDYEGFENPGDDAYNKFGALFLVDLDVDTAACRALRLIPTMMFELRLRRVSNSATPRWRPRRQRVELETDMATALCHAINKYSRMDVGDHGTALQLRVIDEEDACVPADKAKEVTSKALAELHVPVESSPEQILAAYRTVCLQRVFGLTTTDAESDETFQRQAVAYRFLRSLPLLRGVEYRADDILARLRPLDPLTLDEANERASAMLDVSIGMMEQAQRAWALPYTNYVITVHYCLRKHLVRRRYREFETLHQVLAQKLPVLPELPERSWLYKLRMPSDRAQCLTQYLLRVIRMLSIRGLYCIEIMEFLEIDVARVRAEEEGLAIDYLARASAVGRSGNVFYIISAGWLEAWKRFVANRRHPPGRITNDHLLREVKGPVEDLLPGRHYRAINFLTWQYLSMVYGGGPVIMRKSASIYGRPAYDMQTLAVLLQKIVRGFLGRVHAKRRRIFLMIQDPRIERQLTQLERDRRAEERMTVVRRYVAAREFQIRHIASLKIQRAFRRHLLRQEHALLMAESAVPHGAQNFQHVEEYFSLEEIGLIRDPKYRLAHFLVTMNKGVPIQMVKSRRKAPKWRLFRIDQIGSQLIWSSKKRVRSVRFGDVIRINVETPLVLKNVLGRRRSIAHHQGVVLTYNVGENENVEVRELILICESECDCDALYQGLSALIAETQTRTANGASYVDGHGVIRKKYPHAKRIIQEAEQLIDQQHRNPFLLAVNALTKA